MAAWTLTKPQPDFNSTPWSVTCATFTQDPDFLPPVEDVDRFLVGDLKHEKVVTFGKFLIGLGASEEEVSGTRRDETIEKILEDGTVLQLFEAYCQQVSGEQERYGPFCELVNHCMSLLGIQSLLFTRNDPKHIRGVRGSRRKPDVVAVDSTNPFVADGRWRSHSERGPKIDVPLTFEELKFIFEFKLHVHRIPIQDNVIQKLERVFSYQVTAQIISNSSESSSDPPSHPLTKSQGKKPPAKKRQVSSKKPVKHKKLQGQAESSSSAKKRMQKEADLENDKGNRKKKRFKPDDWDANATIELKVSGARYAADMLSRCPARRHCIEGLVIDGVLFMSYYDHSGPLISRGLDFVKDRYLFVLLVKTLVQLSSADCGYLECMEDVSMQNIDDISVVAPLPSDDQHMEPCVVSPGQSASHIDKVGEGQGNSGAHPPPLTLSPDLQKEANDENELQERALPSSDPFKRPKSITDLAKLEYDVFGGPSPLSSQISREETATPESREGEADELSETVVSDSGQASLSEDTSHRDVDAEEEWEEEEEEEEEDEQEEEEGEGADGDYVPSDEGNKEEDRGDRPKWRLKTRHHDFFLYHQLDKREPYGIVSRSTRVFLGVCATLDKGNPNRLYAVKMSWPHSRRRPEGGIIALAREALARLDSDTSHKKEYGDKNLADSLPKLFLCEDLDDLLKEGSFRRSVLGEEFQPLSRILRVLAYEYLVPLHALDNLEHFKQAVRDIVLVHHFLSVSDEHILHRDISLGNLMVRIEGDDVHGVLNDWDLAMVGDPANDQHTGERTGTRIYMSCDLFENPPPLHMERFDWESFFYVIVWIASRYSAGKEVDNSVLSHWHEPVDKKLKATKREVLFGYGDGDNLQLTDFYEPLRLDWIEPLQEMFFDGEAERKAFHAAYRGAPADSDVHKRGFDKETMGGKITWERFWAILRN